MVFVALRCRVWLNDCVAWLSGCRSSNRVFKLVVVISRKVKEYYGRLSVFLVRVYMTTVSS